MKIFSTLKFIASIFSEKYLNLKPSDERRLNIWENRLRDELRGRQRQWLIKKARKKICIIYARSDRRRTENLLGSILCYQKYQKSA